jgi:methylenetetrahydrofolate--tRNA-(uracil-5-)-methyltransferase
LGSLIGHLTQTQAKHFQPSNINFGLFPPWDKKVPKKFRGQMRMERALASLQQWIESEVKSQSSGACSSTKPQ